MELPEEVTKEIDAMVSALEAGKETTRKKMKEVLDDYIYEALERFDIYIEDGERYRYQRWIIQTCDSIIEGLLSGDTKWLKQQSIIGEYHWDKVMKIRLAILKANKEEIENSFIRGLQQEIESLQSSLTSYRQRNAY